MYISDFSFKPHSDMNADNQDIVLEHGKKIKKHQYKEAVSFLEDNDYQDGFRASLFNYIEDKMKKYQIYILNKFVAKPDEFYSYTEPTDEQMKGKKFWTQPYD